ncbi:hypothetical protein N7G274_009020 [Stereocaulon virgatum]|uniref:Ureidoglycolate hydrolase n=1 Tax=Stereocaulon virgatum TaxID=373712 RepID=A0ABR3ZZX3_9LECA
MKMAPAITSPNVNIRATPLTAEAFAPFGTVITSPLPPSTTTFPSTPPLGSAPANQGTALKYTNISPLTSTYRLAPSGAPAHPTMSMFSCFSRQLRPSINGHTFDVRVLERHPFTTQTFVPLSTPSNTKARSLIIVAPTLGSTPPPATSSGTPYFPQAKQGGPPDLKNLKAFMAEPGMGVTYGVGTWHAPMAVFGGGRVDFVVTQWVSGRGGEDCQEVEIPGGVEVWVDGEGARAKL